VGEHQVDALEVEESRQSCLVLETVNDDGRILLVSEPDDGLSDALNKGFRLATGELVASLNTEQAVPVTSARAQ
jgi:hypothetical protein